MRKEYKELLKTDWQEVNNKEEANYTRIENEDPRKLRIRPKKNEDPFMTLRQEVHVTFYGFTEENQWQYILN